MVDTTADGFLNGRLLLHQPATGHHRAGLDAVLLGATLPETATGTVADLGCGVGTAGLCAAVRCPGVEIILVERDKTLATLAASNARPFAARATVITADLFAPVREREAAGAGPAVADHVLVNPPFHPEGRIRPSPDAAKAAAYMLGPGDYDRWIRAAAHIARGTASLAMIVRADDIASWLQALEGRFGGIVLLPVHPKAFEPATRLLILGTKGSRAPLRLLPGLVLHAPDGSWMPDIAAVLEGGPLPAAAG